MKGRSSRVNGDREADAVLYTISVCSVCIEHGQDVRKLGCDAMRRFPFRKREKKGAKEKEGNYDGETAACQEAAVCVYREGATIVSNCWFFLLCILGERRQSDVCSEQEKRV